MFFKKKKETKPMVKFTFSHPLLGNIQYWNNLEEWQTTTLYKFRIFKKEYDVYIYIYIYIYGFHQMVHLRNLMKNKKPL